MKSIQTKNLPMTIKHFLRKTKIKPQTIKRNENLTNEQSHTIYGILLQQSQNGKLPRGSLTRSAKTFSVLKRTVARI